jgi:hypothetical protein
MTAPKKSDKVSPAAETPSALPPPADPLELTDADLESVQGGAVAIDNYASADWAAN